MASDTEAAAMAAAERWVETMEATQAPEEGKEEAKVESPKCEWIR